MVQICLSQDKPPLDYLSFRSWKQISNQKLSNDGKFAAFTYESVLERQTLHIQASFINWKQDLGPCRSFSFTEDSRFFVYQNMGDSLVLVDLVNKQIHYISDVRGFTLPNAGTGDWLACSFKNDKDGLMLVNLNDGKRKKFEDVKKCLFSDDGLHLLMYSSFKDISNNSLVYYDVNQDKVTALAKGVVIKNFVLDRKGLQVVFTVQKSNDQANQIWHYKDGMESAVLRVGPETLDFKQYHLGSKQPFFSEDGQLVFFYLQNNSVIESPNANPIKVDVWGYRKVQAELEESPLNSGKSVSRQYLMGLNLRGGLCRLEEDQNERVLQWSQDRRFSLLQRETSSGSKKNELYLISNSDGSRKLIANTSGRLNYCFFSPSGQYVIWFDQWAKQWFTCKLKTMVTKCITGSINAVFSREDDHPDLADPEGIAAWTENDQSVLIYDRTDIWELDPDAVRKPFNLLNEYGYKHNTRFRILKPSLPATMIVKNGSPLTLTALDLTNKQNGFYKASLVRPGGLNKLVMDNKMYYFEGKYHPVFSQFADPLPPIKAKFCDTYLLCIKGPLDYPNLYVTNDLSNFKQLTYLKPQKSYNWYITELHNYRLKGGGRGNGILFKPENFNPTKRYPVIFYYYEKSSDNLNVFEFPDLSNGGLNIPYFVSQGYLVFVPDIYYRPGEPGMSALSSVVSAANYLSKMKWVNRQKMALQGHSFGGYETNFILTHSRLFAAASSSAAVCNLVSAYGSTWGLNGDGASKFNFFEKRQGRIGGTLWQKKALYIKNSPIFYADKVTTPLLIMHNKDDGAVPWSQGVEWFLGLNRLGKKTWMLQYDGEAHTIDNTDNQLDFTIRLSEFFDHYLKDKPAPVWMIRGGPIDIKGQLSGYQLDSGVTP